MIVSPVSFCLFARQAQILICVIILIRVCELAGPDTEGLACNSGSIVLSFGFYVNENNTIQPCPLGRFCPGDLNFYPCAGGDYSDSTGAATCFTCPPGTHTQKEGESACTDCPFRGVNCFQREGGRPLLEPYFWRFNDSLPIFSNSEFYTCVFCSLDAENGTNEGVYTFTCPPGHDKTIPLCGACVEGFYVGSDGTCASCESETYVWTAIILIFVVVVASMCIAKLKKYSSSISAQFANHKVFFERIVVLFQVLLSFREVYRIDENEAYPENYSTFISNALFQILSLDIFFSIGGWACVVPYDFHDRLLATTMIPTIGLVLIGLWLWFAGRNKNLESAVYFICTFSLVPVSTVLFQTFSCSAFQFGYDFGDEQFEVENRLRADFTINCDSPRHKFFEV